MPVTTVPEDAPAEPTRPSATARVPSSAHPRIEARDVLVAVAYAVIVVVLVFAGVRNSGFVGPELSWGTSVSLPLLLVAAAGTLWRRRAPVVTLAVTGALSLAEVIAGGQITAYILLFEALFSPVVHGSRRLARATTMIAIGGSLVALVVGAVVTGSVELVFVLLMVVTLVAATPLLWGWEVRHHRDARHTAEALARAEHDLAAIRSARAVEGERRRIAHDLHDVIAGHLSAVSLHTSLASGLDDREARDRSLATARDSAKAALRDLQSMISVLATEEQGTLPQATLDWESLTERLRGRDPQAVVRIDEAVTDPSRVEPSVQAALLRIAAEAVTNAARHGQAPISLHVEMVTGNGRSDGGPTTGAGHGQADGVHLVLENRIGERAEPGTGLGVGAIGHRAAAVGGTATSGPTSGTETWRVQAHLPARTASPLASGLGSDPPRSALLEQRHRADAPFPRPHQPNGTDQTDQEIHA